MSATRTVAAVALAVLLATSGCIGFLTGDEALSFEAEQATVSGDALSETGYEEVGVSSHEINETVSVADQQRRVEVTNWQAQYERSVDVGPVADQRAAVFVALSTPKVEVLDRTFNPVGELSNRELLERLQSQYDQLQVGSKVGGQNVTVLGTDTRVDTFEGSANFGGTTVDVYVHVTTVEHGDDYVVAIAIYPQQLDGEEQRVYALLRGLEHAG